MYAGDPAREITVDGAAVKVRDPWRVGILTLVTLGIYGIVWFYMVNAELSRWAEARRADGVAANPILVTVGYLIPIVNVGVWLWTLARIRRAQRVALGRVGLTWGATVAAAIVGLVPLAGVVVWHEHVQHNLNLIWQPSDAGAGAPAAAGGGEPVPALS
jgi:hypothetical protein